MATAELDTTVAFMAKAAENLPGILYQFGIDAQGVPSFRYVSDGARAIWELTPEQVTTDFAAVYKLVHPEDVETFQRSINEAATSGSVWRNEHRIIAPSGRVRWIQGISRPERFPDGSVVFSGVLLDVTEHKDAERELQSIVDQLSTPMITVWDRVLVLPLIGDLSTARIERAVAELLPRIARDGVASVILDLTGITRFEPTAAQDLLNAIRAVSLLGAEALLTGITSMVSRTIVELGVDLGGVQTYSTVAQALQRILRQQAGGKRA